MTATDITDPLASIDARLSLTLGHVDDAVTAMRRTLQHQPITPTYARLMGSAVADANGVATVVLAGNGPTMGRMWHVRNIVVGGTDPTVTAAGVADVFIIAAATGPDSPSLTEWRDRATTLPLPAFYGVGEMVVRAQERLVIRFSAATTDQQYAAAASIMEIEEAPVKQEINV